MSTRRGRWSQRQRAAGQSTQILLLVQRVPAQALERVREREREPEPAREPAREPVREPVRELVLEPVLAPVLELVPRRQQASSR